MSFRVDAAIKSTDVRDTLHLYKRHEQLTPTSFLGAGTSDVVRGRHNIRSASQEREVNISNIRVA